MSQWCIAVQRKLDGLFLRGRITLPQYDQLADLTQYLIGLTEVCHVDWDNLNAETRLAEALRSMGVSA